MRNGVHKFKASHGEPEDNAVSLKRVEDSGSRTPADGETSKEPPKKRQSDHRSSRYDKERQDVDSDEFGEGSGKTKNSRKRNDDEEESGKMKFACPFYKRDRQAFMSERTCVGPGWDTVHRVKEHIFRRHMLSSTQCENCLEQFETRPALDDHLQTPCREKPPLGSYGINKEQESQLRSRKMYQKSFDGEEKWRAIYKIIFPGEGNIPSPYYEPEVPEFPDIYQQMLIQDLPRIITEQLTESGLMGPSTVNVMTKQQASTGGVGRKSNGERNSVIRAPAPANQQLERQIEDVVKVAVRKFLAQVDGSNEPINDFQIPLLNVESPGDGSKGWTEEESQVQLIGLAPLQDDTLRPPAPGVAKTGLGVMTRAQYPTPTSSAFIRSPEDGSMERPQMGSTSPPGLNLTSIFRDSHLDNTFLHTTGGGSIPELPSVTWGTVSSNDTVFSGDLYTAIRQNSNPNASEPAACQNQNLFANQETRPEDYLLGSWDFAPQVTSTQSTDSGYGPIAGPPDNNGLDNLDFDDWWHE
ncbi:hypothetical protein MRS44_018588 [Fusarium solani]|uniref:uncharacterized protein n=1 Tax=Fusarium solani TaxID=169388 RepID=UPI0032C48BA1|nr:hypothetical protein MRS44_018588 [Fusarium solani]